MVVTAALAAATVAGWAPAATSSCTQIACFCRGMRIRTDRGEVAVKDLVIVDRLLTRMGEARTLIWIGRRSYVGPFLVRHPSVWPICIRAGASAEGVPARTLYVSPAHGFYVDNVLIPAYALINGATIHRVGNVSRVDYFHLEVESHDVIFAEAAATETNIDQRGAPALADRPGRRRSPAVRRADHGDRA